MGMTALRPRRPAGPSLPLTIPDLSQLCLESGRDHGKKPGCSQRPGISPKTGLEVLRGSYQGEPCAARPEGWHCIPFSGSPAHHTWMSFSIGAQGCGRLLVAPKMRIMFLCCLGMMWGVYQSWLNRRNSQ